MRKGESVKKKVKKNKRKGEIKEKKLAESVKKWKK